MQRASFVVPGVPVSVNVRWAPVGRVRWYGGERRFERTGVGIIKTREARDFETRIRDHAFIARIKEQWDKSNASIGVAIAFFGGGVDIDNGIKGILDALQGSFYYNDGQVDELHVQRCREEIVNPRIEVEVWERIEKPITKKERVWSRS
jgi:hypothetical protein